MTGDERFGDLPEGADPLIADLRLAFEYHADALAAPGACWLDDMGGATEAYSGAPDPVVLAGGVRLGDFEVIEVLGRGGMGVVYRARQVSLGREVALKVLPGYARHGRTAVKRFQAEARAAGRVQHTNVVPIYAQGEHEGQYFYAMELIDGITLDKVIHNRPDLLGSTRVPVGSSTGWRFDSTIAELEDSTTANPTATETDTPREHSCPNRTLADYRHVAELLSEVADGLECAHQHDVIHRDVKPHNLLLSVNNRLHLTDFGLARLAEEPHITIDGEIMGTPAYLSPEQVRGDGAAIDRRSDIYSLGVTLYEIITGRKPFDGQNRAQILSRIANQEAAPPRRIVPRIPVDLETICQRAMEKDPRRRHGSAAELAEDLRLFAEGRPILSRKLGRIGKAAKWAGRHKALTAVMLLSSLVLLLVGGWSWSAQSARRDAAQTLLSGAYEQLAFQDYRSPERVEADLDRADKLGADRQGMHLARALAALGAMDQAAAVDHLESLLAENPRDSRARYMLAWAQWRSGDRTQARDTFDLAGSNGPPATADGWFFRGLAIHNAAPDLAAESYRKAVALRASEHGFYPQAVLHLARARNQQLYALRSLAPLPETLESLRQLVEHQAYGAYPHYLLSIAHRLAAEIYSGSGGTRDDSLVEEHYAQALEWARRGQEVDPTTDRPITAEAECLESMGRYAEAVEARTRAIATATSDQARWEGYHYRWRLHYWLEDYDQALTDLDVCAQYDPKSLFYAHFYPALVLAEIGDLEAALDHVRAVAYESPQDATAALWSASGLRMLGRMDDARELLATRENLVDYAQRLEPPQTEEWLRRVYAANLAGDDPSLLDGLAAEAESPWRLWGESYFHAALIMLGEGRRDAARAAMQRSYRSFDDELRYTYHAKLIYFKMRTNCEWPAWIMVESRRTRDVKSDLDVQEHIKPRVDEERDEP